MPYQFGSQNLVPKFQINPRLGVTQAPRLSISSCGEGEVLFFVHGWPDDASVWRAQVDRLKDKYQCKCVTMPHFGGRESAIALQHRPQGYSFEEMAEILADNIRRDCGTSPVTLVLHDWGCVWGFMLQTRHPDLVKRIVALDVGLPSCMSGFEKVSVALLTYQFWPLTAYFLLRVSARLGSPFRRWGQAVADWMIRAFTKFIGYGSKRITADASYPYVHFLTGLGFREPKLTAGAVLPSCPCLFMYGKRKPYMFHSAAWERHLRSRSDCEVIPVNAGHWLQVQKAELVNHAIETWLEKKDMGAAPHMCQDSRFQATSCIFLRAYMPWI
ncbi:unnamed protein product [Durusdinium trenchii]|uniref:AB hydrolase-1 domain-containing protein n=1 Tax=Durusdinium trenchii TaxID=1381693 RepID=A0ABP0JLT5_9DINO